MRSMKFLKVLSAADAFRAISERVKPPGAVRMPTCSACGAVCAEDAVSREDYPDRSRSTVDGYAVRARDTFGVSESIPGIFRIVGRVRMGEICARRVERGEAIYVPTGAAMPDGADCVAPIEHCEEADGSECVAHRAMAVGENVISRGEDISAGDVLLRKGERITIEKMSALLAVGISEVTVRAPFRAAVLSTGDELVDPALSPKPIGSVRDVNAHSIRELCETRNIDVVFESRANDDFDALTAAFDAALEAADIVFVSGGSGSGPRDCAERLFSARGAIAVRGIALKPGKPTIVASTPDGKLLIGLPGNPAACIFVLRALALPAITGLPSGPSVAARTTANIPSAPGRTVIQPVIVRYGATETTCEPLFIKSAYLGTLSEADGYVVIPRNAEGICANELVRVFLFD